MKRGDTVPFRPWADTLFKERLANDAKDDPTSNCIVGGVPRSDFVPYPFKILETPGIVVILYEAIHSIRQLRPHELGAGSLAVALARLDLPKGAGLRPGPFRFG